MSDVDRLGVERAIREALAHIAGPGFVHVSLDMDASIPTSRPGSERPSGAASPTARRTSRWSSSPSRARRLARGGRGESDPRPENETAKLAVELVASALGARIL